MLRERGEFGAARLGLPDERSRDAAAAGMGHRPDREASVTPLRGEGEHTRRGEHGPCEDIAEVVVASVDSRARHHGRERRRRCAGLPAVPLPQERAPGERGGRVPRGERMPRAVRALGVHSRFQRVHHDHRGAEGLDEVRDPIPVLRRRRDDECGCGQNDLPGVRDDPRLCRGGGGGGGDHHDRHQNEDNERTGNGHGTS